MKKFRAISLAILFGSVTLPLTASAGGESGFYVGAGLGDSNVSQLDGHLSGDDTGVKAFVGYNIGVVPLMDLAVEGAYVNLGKVKSGNVSYDQTAWDAFGLLGLNLGPFGVFGKAGVAAWEGETSIGGVSSTESGTDPVLGVGARLQILSLTGRIEYEYYDIDATDDVYMASVSLLYTF